MAYGAICGCGPQASILHYGHAARPNYQLCNEGQMVLMDLGGEYDGYATAITTMVAIGGKFTEQQRGIYEAVLDAQQTVEREMKPGVKWPDMHRLAERVILTHLLKIGIVQNGSVDEMMAANLGATFMPHGLGHFLGMNTHDVGGYNEEFPKSQEEGLCWLRITRTLQENMVLTVEPGCYFNESWMELEMAKPEKAKFLNKEKIREYVKVGGVRLEDDVVVTKDGIENFTYVPRQLEEVEELMALKLSSCIPALSSM